MEAEKIVIAGGYNSVDDYRQRDPLRMRNIIVGFCLAGRGERSNMKNSDERSVLCAQPVIVEPGGNPRSNRYLELYAAELRGKDLGADVRSGEGDA